MPFDIWGNGLVLPQRSLVAYSFIVLYGVLLVYFLYQNRGALAEMRAQKWLATIFLSLAALSISQFDLLSIMAPALSNASGSPGGQLHLIIVGSVPLLLAAAALNPGAALVVGFITGLGRAFWHTHQLFDPFIFAFAALLAGRWLQQSYEGAVFRWLRRPAIAGALGLLAAWPLLWAATYSSVGSEFGYAAALDWALRGSATKSLLLLVEGLASGVLVYLTLLGAPQFRPQADDLAPAPYARSVRTRLLTNFAAFGALLTFGLLVAVYAVSMQVSKQLLVNQLARDAAAVSQQLPAFRGQLESLLEQLSSDPILLDGDQDAIAARLAEPANAYYQRLILASDDGQVVSFYPDRDVAEIALSEPEAEAVAEALAGAEAVTTAAHETETGQAVISVVAPVRNEDGGAEAALIGRVPNVVLADTIAGLRGAVGEGSGFVVDEAGRIIVHGGQTTVLEAWSPPVDARRTVQARVDNGLGTAYEGFDQKVSAHELVYYRSGPDHPWQVVMTIPYQAVLSLALEVGTPLLAVVIVILAAFALNLGHLGKGVTRPLRELVTASQQLAAGRLDATIPRSDTAEFGQIGRAFYQLRRSIQRHFGESRLMLEVSQDISTKISIQEGIPTILRAAVRGTGASGARALVLSPTGGPPLTFAAGHMGEGMRRFDREIFRLARREKEFLLGSPEEMEARLGFRPPSDHPLRAIMAIALYAQDRFQGVLWCGYRQPHTFETTELNLLHTMASQASVLVENVRLYTTAEGQHRRLAAVLASTSDAVVVTDHTKRVLLVNRALARLFNLDDKAAKGRPVSQVIQHRGLVEALTESEERVRNLEIITDDGRVLYAGVATIFSNENQVLGRVAVLHDITHLKELDEMKTDFVSTVSHDLRSPLTYIRGYITMLSILGDLNEDQKACINKILHGVDDMSTLTDDLLALGRIEAKVDLVQDVVDAASLVRRVVAEQADAGIAQGVVLEVETAPALPTIKGNEALIHRALANLVTNAIKYAPGSGVVMLRAFCSDGALILSVRDQGPGIAPQDQPRLFEKFYRIHTRGRPKVKGYGIGLAIVKSIAELHGGKAWCHSQLGRGSTFFLSFPAEGCE